MTDTNELTGRELAVACARAMGWTVTPMEHHMLAWLHERGIVNTASSRLAVEASFVAIPSMESLEKWVRGSNLTEALQRLVVAVAQRGNNKEESL